MAGVQAWVGPFEVFGHERVAGFYFYVVAFCHAQELLVTHIREGVHLVLHVSIIGRHSDFHPWPFLLKITRRKGVMSNRAFLL